jgi:hypothetical protein
MGFFGGFYRFRFDDLKKKMGEVERSIRYMDHS